MLRAIHEWQQIVRTGAVLLTANEDWIEQAITLSLVFVPSFAWVALCI